MEGEGSVGGDVLGNMRTYEKKDGLGYERVKDCPE